MDLDLSLADADVPGLELRQGDICAGPVAPADFDLVTARAVRLEPEVLGALASRLTPGGRVLLWIGEEVPELPPNLIPDREMPLAGSDRRRILGLRRREGPSETA